LEGGDEINIVLLVVVGCTGMLLLAVFIVLFVLYYQKRVLTQQHQLQLAENLHQKELLSAIIRVEEKERERIAKNIHDDVGTLLNVLKMNLEKRLRNSHNEELVASLDKRNLQLLEESIQSIRGIAKDLLPPTLVKLGLVKALNELCSHINSSGKVTIRFMPGNLEIRLKEQTELQLYRMSSELMNNIIKHSGADKIELTIEDLTDCYRLVLTHNGKGINALEAAELVKEQKGLGLKSIVSRAQLIHAQVIYKADDSGSGIIIEFPKANG
jgi:signal transduction histidine kinase